MCRGFICLQTRKRLSSKESSESDRFELSSTSLPDLDAEIRTNFKGKINSVIKNKLIQIRRIFDSKIEKTFWDALEIHSSIEKSIGSK